MTDVDINASGRRAAEQALVEIKVLKTSAKRFRELTEELFACRDAGAQLPSDLLDQISTAMDELIVELGVRAEGGLP